VLLTGLIDDAVARFASIMTLVGGNVLRTEAALYRAIRDACDAMAQMAAGMVGKKRT
jgi:hypothetical protein